MPTFLRSADEVRSIAGYQPFADVTAERSGKMQVAMVGSKVDQPAQDSVLKLSNNADMLEIVDRELYWWPKGNFLDSQLDLNALEAILGPFTIPHQKHHRTPSRQIPASHLIDSVCSA